MFLVRFSIACRSAPVRAVRYFGERGVRVWLTSFRTRLPVGECLVRSQLPAQTLPSTSKCKKTLTTVRRITPDVGGLQAKLPIAASEQWPAVVMDRSARNRGQHTRVLRV